MSMKLSRLTLDLTDTFPTYEKYGLKKQMDRCAISIPSNIAEGSSRTNKSFSHFLDISLGSSFELQTQILLANHRKYLSDEKTESLKLRLKNFKKQQWYFRIL
ncbi:four helix bundle protein [Chryseobacterium sp. X308]|uniref:four helix bundle protein n=1 Tax=Chryseobacterium sp. X308 TaxID=2884873 RepID=UPI00293E3EDB|nr:four helix bundle protein [Chryseobacterium sp. X308]